MHVCGLVCVHLKVLTEQTLPAWCGLAQPAITGPSLAPDAHGWEGPSPPTCPGCSPKSRPSYFLCPSLRSLYGPTNKWVDRQLHLPSFLSPLLSAGIRCWGLSSLRWFIKPLTRCPPRFAAMTFNTSGMIRNLRADRGRQHWAPGHGSRSLPPCKGPCPVGKGGAGGQAGGSGPDQQAAGRGGQPRQQLELPEWHSSGPGRDCVGQGRTGG